MTDDRARKLLTAINTVAQDYDRHEQGLPLHDRETTGHLMALVLNYRAEVLAEARDQAKYTWTKDLPVPGVHLMRSKETGQVRGRLVMGGFDGTKPVLFAETGPEWVIVPPDAEWAVEAPKPPDGAYVQRLANAAREMLNALDGSAAQVRYAQLQLSRVLGWDDGTEADPTTQSGDDRDFVGMPFPEAQKLAEKRGLRWRAIKIDGSPVVVTRDFVGDRVNFVLKADPGSAGTARVVAELPVRG